MPLKVSDEVEVYIGKLLLTSRDYSHNADVRMTLSEAWSFLKANKTATAILLTPLTLVVEVVSVSREDLPQE
jgi:hypothetical protein